MTELDRDTGRGLAQELVERLKEKILGGEIEPGRKLPAESSLMAEYAVSRTVVREAISRLQAAGLVETFQGRGSFVLALPEATTFEPTRIRSHRDVLDLLDFRIGVETEAAGLAAHRRTEHQLKAIERALKTFKRAAGNPARAVEADFAFHLKIAAASGNRFYTELLGSLGPMMIMLPRTRLDPSYELTDATHFTRVTLEHENIHDAIARADAEAARAAVRVHLSNSRHRLKQP
ncbi:DNA-binding FadR family transcriptional regulator [Kribbella sp. VKM Ac-2527]|uniref:DNA-binding FadR family transcriptional regulator n=1 Tax=Kribbella caucasensis TaxID=2512215 RepID=A0A4R6KLX9_9ACTN|nr:FadR/GntR family transcriptional regulator [Kribbella sp. VKM Ac-2527]TDO52568.1 DNA-binding FadR family transcriptional regulator [Kribbella sp. VKM Ac-2527]